MAYNFLPCDRNQAYLLPPSLTDWLPEDDSIKKKENKGSLGNRELSRLSQTAIGSNGWIRKSLCNML
jgi:hypothetical protein